MEPVFDAQERNMTDFVDPTPYPQHLLDRAAHLARVADGLMPLVDQLCEAVHRLNVELDAWLTTDWEHRGNVGRFSNRLAPELVVLDRPMHVMRAAIKAAAEQAGPWEPAWCKHPDS
jgi:hypothetical protein